MYSSFFFFVRLVVLFADLYYAAMAFLINSPIKARTENKEYHLICSIHFDEYPETSFPAGHLNGKKQSKVLVLFY